jgi:RNA polymerase sigma-70 factor (ECF subfamily)
LTPTITVNPTDEDLLREIASGSEEPMGALYQRYAPIVFGMAAQALGRASAEEIVQDFFVSVWRGAASFDPKKGMARAWLLQIAHYRIANELRGRSRRPRTVEDPDGEEAASLPDPSPDQSEEAWLAHRRQILQRALEQLPPPQRQALGLAFFSDLSHGEVAGVLGLPLGTVKSRVRSGLSQLRARLAPLAAALLVVVLAAGLLLRIASEKRGALARDERALTMLTSSDAVAIRITAAPGQDPATHATYRFRLGSPIAVVTFSKFPAPGPGESYRAWASVGGRWVLLGEAVPDAGGRARFIAEAPALANPPERLVVAAERGTSGAAPGERVIVAWSADRK